MMKIVVCDESMEDLEKIKGLLTRYMEINKSVRFEIEYFTDSAKLYHQILIWMRCRGILG